MQPTHAGLPDHSRDGKQSRNGLKTLASHALLTGWEDLGRAEVFLDPGHISLYDLTGRLLKQVVLASGQRQWNIDVADLSPGLYLFRIITEDRNYASGKLNIIR